MNVIQTMEAAHTIVIIQPEATSAHVMLVMHSRVINMVVKVRCSNSFHYKYCVDINECNQGNGGCEQSCTDTAGSFTCTCATGYQLTSGRHCSGIHIISIPILSYSMNT